MTWCNFQEGFLVLSEKMSSAWSEQWRFADFEERELLHIWVIISPVLGKEPPRGGLPISTAFSIKVVEQLDLNLSRIVWNTLTLIFINIKWWKPVISFHVLKQEKEQSKPVSTRGTRSVGTIRHSPTQPNRWKAVFENGCKYWTLS